MPTYSCDLMRSHAISLLLPEPCPVSDALKVFDGHPSTGVCSFRNDLLCNRMVGIRFKAPLSAGDRFQFTLGVQWPFAASFLLCRFSLKRPFHFSIMLSRSLDIIAHMHLAVAVNGQIYDAEINPGQPYVCRRGKPFNPHPVSISSPSKPTAVDGASIEGEGDADFQWVLPAQCCHPPLNCQYDKASREEKSQRSKDRQHRSKTRGRQYPDACAVAPRGRRSCSPIPQRFLRSCVQP